MCSFNSIIVGITLTTVLVLSDNGPLRAVAPNDDDYNDKEIIIFLHRACVDEKTADDGTTASDLFNRLFDQESDCLLSHGNGNNGDGVYASTTDYFEFSTIIGERDCLDHINIDHDAYCIANVEYSPNVHATYDYTCGNNKNGQWALKAILNDKYFDSFENNNLNVYVIDTLVNINHPEFEYIINKGILPGTYNDEVNHGTHVAGIIMGNTIGVLRDENIGLYSCAALGAFGGTWEAVIDCLIEVKNDMDNNPGKKGVINMSLSGYCGPNCNILDEYFANIKNIGGIIVVAGANDNNDACLKTPAGEPDAITVGSYQYGYIRSSFSNYGDCIDTWGPGSNIYSSLYYGYGYLSGTSMASPAIAGLIGALLLIDEFNTDFNGIKSILSCDNCVYLVDIFDAQSKIDEGISTDCINFKFILEQHNKCLIPCHPLTPNLPCKHLNFGDHSCFKKDKFGNCPAGTVNCDNFQKNKCLVPCHDLTPNLPCKHLNLGDDSCFEKNLYGKCPAGTMDCSDYYNIAAKNINNDDELISELVEKENLFELNVNKHFYTIIGVSLIGSIVIIICLVMQLRCLYKQNVHGFKRVKNTDLDGV